MTSLPDGQDWDPARYGREARFVPELGREVLGWLAPVRGERILDLGCGDGRLTSEITAAGAEVVGVDSSPAQVAAARNRGLDVRLMAAESLAFDGGFDAVFSNAALHWMTRPDPVISGVRRALRPGGRFVAEMGGAGNVARVLDALLAELAARGIDGRSAVPWYFPTPEDYRGRLERAGFRVERMEHFARPTEIDCDMTDWLEIFAGALLGLVPEPERAGFRDAVAARLRPALLDRGRNGWWVDYVRLRFAAVRP